MLQSGRTMSSWARKSLALKECVARYGSVGVATHTVLSLASLGTWYSLLALGLDLSSLAARLKLEPSSTASKTSRFALAYVIHKATMVPTHLPPPQEHHRRSQPSLLLTQPIRVPITLIATPLIARRLPASWIKHVGKSH